MSNNPPRAFFFRRISFMLAGFLLFIILPVGLFFWHKTRPATPHCLLLMAAPNDQWKVISRAERAGILALLKDHLELCARKNVITEAELASPTDPTPARLTLGGRRLGDQLELTGTLEISGARQSISTPLLAPAEAFAHCLSAFGLAPHPHLLPKISAHFWLLTAATGNTLGIASKETPSLTMVRQMEPQCASAHATHAIQAFQALIRQTDNSSLDSHQRCQEAFQSALSFVPHYPRALSHYAQFLTNMGEAKEAMRLLFAGIQTYPRLALLREALACPARNAGLLAGAKRSLDIRQRLVPFARFKGQPAEPTYLYLNDLTQYEASIAPTPQILDGARDFHRAYVALLKGDQGLALSLFRDAQQSRSYPPYEKLARIYALYLTSNNSDAYDLLQTLKAERVRLKAMDGEFTFKIAEAFGYMGHQEEALQTALTAFAQGFGCTEWYDKSPFLAKVPRQARWEALVQHLEERQAHMEKLFPVHCFGE